MSEDEQLQQEINLLERDVVKLEDELEQLAHDESALLKEVAKLEQLQEEQNEPLVEDHRDVVPIIKHTYFDPSIAQFFDDAEATTQVQPLEKRFIDKADTKENIMYENILRMSGVTAFPINKHLFPNDEILGIRFDTFSSKSRSFKQPHYVILLKSKLKNEQSFWRVHKTTLPVHVPLDRYQEELEKTHDLDKFATSIHLYLARDNEKKESDT
ncbi:MCM21 [Candida theae]|uniref:MCM21 n=1 Tax=Candida theae TaxID=1198502 RepID=A0AAD5BHT1_9ASCO|nr:MCM21 [Candida theae]KAI5964443.1 MCM21 [Candida theae]